MFQNVYNLFLYVCSRWLSSFVCTALLNVCLRLFSYLADDSFESMNKVVSILWYSHTFKRDEIGCFHLSGIRINKIAFILIRNYGLSWKAVFNLGESGKDEIDWIRMKPACFMEILFYTAKFYHFLQSWELLRLTYALQSTFLVLFCLHNHFSVHLWIYSVSNGKLASKLAILYFWPHCLPLFLPILHH